MAHAAPDLLAALLSQSAAAAFANPSPASADTATDTQLANPSPDPADDASADPAPTAPPTIEIQGNNPAHLNVGDSDNDLGARITGPTQADTNLGIKTFLNGALVSNIVLDTTAPATDTIDYVATNSGGTSTSTRTVFVEAPQEQSPPLTATTSSATTTATSTPAQ